ncbi:SGNH/GDSL hydrolase family protein [Maribacter cobaltidurans]|uniref:G-D-S-L family lipolytic protein n=1 Tax=Maribacter cobaltidurans TaxID=1178778 RepID=A0A223VB94_9FLAO|nr:G-D-S-L family lipolytic protein [Maribacter cobaltidurans]ASV32644.1 G-D-S-L family lipolytic protein [Maribacter cobaltidurans]
MKKITYIFLSSLLLVLTNCNDPEDVDLDPIIEPDAKPELTAGSADFSNYISLGNSLTAGFTDGALFQAGQNFSIPNILSQKFAIVGGGDFIQPLTSDNLGGLAAGGERIQGPRLVFGGSGPVPLESVIGPVTVGTDIVLNNPSGPFNNLGVPGAKSFHLLAPGYGNLANVSLGLANPYFVRMTGSTPDISVLEMAVSQSPTFFTLWIGNNDVLGYALSGGDGTNPITPVDGPPGVGFQNTYGALIQTLTSSGAQGVVANIPNVTSIPHFTTVPYNPLDPTNPDFAGQIPTLNTIFGALNQIFTALGATERIITFSTSEASPVVIYDESLTDLSAQITGALNANPGFPTFVQQFGLPPQAAPLVAGLLGSTYGQARQATDEDLFVLPSSNVIGTVNMEAAGALVGQGLSATLAGQFSVEGISLPLADKWVLTPEEQTEIATATTAFNQIISASASQAGLALVDANGLLEQLANGGITSGDYTLTSNLVVGSAFSLDGVHPTARGYALLANEFMKAIDATYGSNFEDSGNLVNVGDYPTNFSPTLQ